MSHFAFGLLRENSRNRDTEFFSNISVVWGWQEQPEPVREMLQHANAAENAVVFSLVQAADDTADSLISPFVQEEQAIREAICEMIRWVAYNGGGDLFLTEGFDDRFEEHSGDVHSLEEYLKSDLSLSLELPSLRLRVICPEHG